MGRDELAGVEAGVHVAEPGQQFARIGVNADPRPAIGNIDINCHVRSDLADIEARILPAALHVEARRAVHVVPLRLIFAVTVEHLDAMVFAVGDIDPAVGVTADIVGDVELAGIGTRLAPRHHPLAVGGVFVDPGIAVAVGDVKKVGLRRQRGVSAAMERLAAHIGRRLAGDADGQQPLTVEGALANRVIAVIGQPNRVVGRHVDTVRAHENVLTPRAQEVAFAIEHAHRVGAAVEGVDIVVFVDSDGGDVRVESPPLRQFGPIVDDLIPEAVRSEYYRHGGSSPFRGGWGDLRRL